MEQQPYVLAAAPERLRRELLPELVRLDLEYRRRRGETAVDGSVRVWDATPLDERVSRE
jgi:hypothetical protein